MGPKYPLWDPWPCWTNCFYFIFIFHFLLAKKNILFIWYIRKTNNSRDDHTIHTVPVSPQKPITLCHVFQPITWWSQSSNPTSKTQYRYATSWTSSKPDLTGSPITSLKSTTLRVLLGYANKPLSSRLHLFWNFRLYLTAASSQTMPRRSSGGECPPLSFCRSVCLIALRSFWLFPLFISRVLLRSCLVAGKT